MSICMYIYKYTIYCMTDVSLKSLEVRALGRLRPQLLVLLRAGHRGRPGRRPAGRGGQGGAAHGARLGRPDRWPAAAAAPSELRRPRGGPLVQRFEPLRPPGAHCEMRAGGFTEEKGAWREPWHGAAASRGSGNRRPRAMAPRQTFAQRDVVGPRNLLLRQKMASLFTTRLRSRTQMPVGGPELLKSYA